MADTIDDVLLEVALAIHALGEAIAALQVRQAGARTDAEKRDILLALPTLKSDQRDAEARMSALAASRAAFRSPDDGVLAALHKATEALAAETKAGRSASTVAGASSNVLAALRAIAPGAATAS